MRSPKDLIRSSLDTYGRPNVIKWLFSDGNNTCFCGQGFAIILHNHHCNTVRTCRRSAAVLSCNASNCWLILYPTPGTLSHTT